MAKAEEMMFIDFKADILQPAGDSSATHGLVAPPSTTTEDMFVMEDNHLGDQSTPSSPQEAEKGDGGWKEALITSLEISGWWFVRKA